MQTSGGASRDLDGRVAIVTGSTSGIGVDEAQVLTERGTRVVVVGRNGRRIDVLVNNAGVFDGYATVTDAIPKDNVPMRRFGTPREVAELVAILVSDEAGFMSGSIVTIDGGFTIQ